MLLEALEREIRNLRVIYPKNERNEMMIPAKLLQNFLVENKELELYKEVIVCCNQISTNFIALQVHYIGEEDSITLRVETLLKIKFSENQSHIMLCNYAKCKVIRIHSKNILRISFCESSVRHFLCYSLNIPMPESKDWRETKEEAELQIKQMTHDIEILQTSNLTYALKIPWDECSVEEVCTIFPKRLEILQHHMTPSIARCLITSICDHINEEIVDKDRLYLLFMIDKLKESVEKTIDDTIKPIAAPSGAISIDSINNYISSILTEKSNNTLREEEELKVNKLIEDYNEYHQILKVIRDTNHFISQTASSFYVDKLPSQSKLIEIPTMLLIQRLVKALENSDIYFSTYRFEQIIRQIIDKNVSIDQMLSKETIDVALNLSHKLQFIVYKQKHHSLENTNSWNLESFVSLYQLMGKVKTKTQLFVKPTNDLHDQIATAIIGDICRQVDWEFQFTSNDTIKSTKEQLTSILLRQKTFDSIVRGSLAEHEYSLIYCMLANKHLDDTFISNDLLLLCSQGIGLMHILGIAYILANKSLRESDIIDSIIPADVIVLLYSYLIRTKSQENIYDHDIEVHELINHYNSWEYEMKNIF